MDSITEIVRVQDARAQRESSRRERRNATIGRRWRSNVRKRGARWVGLCEKVESGGALGAKAETKCPKVASDSVCKI